ncbi:caspase family protein [Bradyrhizobium sp. 21]|uniref:caspase family protein n=1 Tax=Bradyrhizobium sp. 21 TaxID=2782666 RepID=UPI001FF93A54|nr:caspase family protein [Bradyrhizobium sp. 21]MCK1389036.1 caspase family protein [Bradyrhizobium sp. 21]
MLWPFARSEINVASVAHCLIGAIWLMGLPSAASAQSAAASVPTRIIAQRGDDVGSAIISANGNVLVTLGGESPVAKVWDARTGRLARILFTLPDAARNHAEFTSLSSDGRRLFGIQNGTAKVWDTETGRTVISFEYGDQGPDGFASMSMDGLRTVSTGKGNKSLVIWDAQTGKQISTIRVNQELKAIAISPDGSKVAAATADKSIRVWDAASGQPVKTLTGHKHDITNVSFSPRGNRLLSQTEQEIRLWSLDAGRVLRSAANDGIDHIYFSADGSRLAYSIGSSGQSVVIWDAEAGTQIAEYPLGEKDDSLAALSDDGRTVWVTNGEKKKTSILDALSGKATGPDITSGTVAGTSSNGKFFLVDKSGTWNVIRSDRSPVQSFHLAPVSTASVALVADGTKIAIAGSDGQVLLRNTKTWTSIGQCHEKVEAKDGPGGIIAFAVSPDGSRVASMADEEIRVCDLESGSRVGAPIKANGQVLGFAAGSSRLLSENDNGGVDLTDIATGTTAKSFGKDINASVVAFAKNRAFVGTGDNKIRIVDLSSGRESRVLRMMVGPVMAVTASPDGQRVAAGSNPFLVKLWNSDTGALLSELKSSPPADIVSRFVDITSIAFSPSDPWLAASYGGQIAIWNLQTSREVFKLGGNAADVRQIAFSADGRQLVSAAADGTVEHWDAKTGTLLATIFSFADGQWIALTPEGFFEASSRSVTNNLNVVRGLNVSSIDQVYDALYRPDLVREKLAGDPKGKVREAAARLDLDRVMASGDAPKVTIVSPADGASVAVGDIVVEAAIAIQGGGIGRVEWRLNSQTLGVENRGIKAMATDRVGSATANGDGTLMISQKFAIEPGDNLIEFAVYNEKGLIASSPARITVKATGRAAATKPRLFILAVGINDYADSRLKLNFAVPDARAIASSFEKAGSGFYESAKVRLLLDDEATSTRMEAAFRQLSTDVKATDVFVFFVAGHGRTLNGKYYFIPQDFRYRDQDSYVQNGVSQEQWQKWIAWIQARKSILIYDTCESGSMTADAASLAPGQRGTRAVEEQAVAYEKLKEAMGRTILAASTDTEPALEGYKGHGILSYAVMDALERAPINASGLINVIDLIKYVDDRVPQISYEAFKHWQYSQARFSGSNFPIARRTAVLGGPPVEQPAGATSSLPIKPTHVVIAAVTVRQQPDATSGASIQLTAGAQVAIVRREGGWIAIARDGKQLGYVEERAVAALQ